MTAQKNGNSPKDSLRQEQARQKDKTKKKEQDDYLEESLEETFPASDPISPGQVDKKKK